MHRVLICHSSRLFPAIFLLLISVSGLTQNYVFARLGGSPVNTTGWNLQGGATVGNIVFNDNSELIVCPKKQSSGAVFYNQPINLSLCSKWKAEFDFRIHDSTGADGLAFCFLEVPPSGFVTGAGLGIPSGANGLKVCFDTWNNCIPFDANTVHKDMPKIEIRYGPGYNECDAMPTRDNFDNTLSFIADDTYKHAVINYNNGEISVAVNGTVYVNGFHKFDYTGYLGFTASTGGYFDNHSIRNAIIYTEMAPSEAGIAAPVCGNTPIQLGVANNNDYLYSWSPATGLSATNISNPVLTLDNTGETTAFVKYFVKTSLKTNPGCASTDSVPVTLIPRPKVDFLMPEICLDDAIALFTDYTSTAEPGLLPYTYLWTFGDPNASAANPNSSTLQNPSHKYSAAANYNMQLRVANNAGCIDSLKKIFTVNGAIPKASFNVLNAFGLCSNTNVQLQDASSVDFGTITKVIIDWGDNITPDQDDNTAAGKIYEHLYPVNNSVSSKTYKILYTAYSGISCVDAVSQSITVNASPKVIFDPVPSLCTNNEAYQITEAKETSGIAGNFFYKGDVVSSSGLINPVAASPGNYPLTAIFTSTNNCRDSAISNVSIYAFPTVEAGPALYMLEGGEIRIAATAGGNDLSYQWTPASYLDDAAFLQPRAKPPSDILYTITVTAEGNCTNEDTVRIFVLKNPMIPNAFTPNGDGINDKWNIRYLNSYPGCDVQLFDRYGQAVFQSAGYNQPWDGTLHGKPVPAGVYYYIINTRLHKKPFTGSVIVIR